MNQLFIFSFIFLYLAFTGNICASTSIDIFYRLPESRTTISQKGGMQAIRDFKTKYIKSFDRQYQKVVELKVIELNTLIADYRYFKTGMNLALLHFDNGIVYPMIIDKAHQEAQLFLATEIKIDSVWTDRFPNAVKGIKFDSNKIFSTSEQSESPKLLALSYASSLSSIELVDAEAYHKQFQIGPKQSQIEGRIVYLTRCQFCHGLKGMGASFAPDFLSGLADSYESSRLYHLVQPEGRLAEKRKIMPHQKDFSRAEARQLWQWLWKAKDQNKWHSYQPFYTNAESNKPAKKTQN